MRTNRGPFSPITGPESGYQGASRGGNRGVASSGSNMVVANTRIVILTITATSDIGVKLCLGKLAIDIRRCPVEPGGGRSGRLTGKHLSRQLPAVGPRRTFRGFWSALNEPVFATTNGQRRKIPKREALVNETAGANSRATKMLIHMMKDIEKKTSAEPPPKPHRHRPSPCD